MLYYHNMRTKKKRLIMYTLYVIIISLYLSNHHNDKLNKVWNVYATNLQNISLVKSPPIGKLSFCCWKVSGCSHSFPTINVGCYIRGDCSMFVTNAKLRYHIELTVHKYEMHVTTGWALFTIQNLYIFLPF